MILDFYTTLSISAALLSFILAPLGCMLLWQRKTLLSDSLSHASFLGMSVAFVFKLPMALGVFISSLGVLLSLKSLQKKSFLTTDVWLNLTSVSALGLGGLVLSLFPTTLHLDSLFYGEFLLLDLKEIALLAGLLLCVAGFFIKFYKNLILTSLHRDLATLYNLNTKTFSYGFLLLLLVVLSLTLKLIGVLLVTAMMLLPCAWAVLWSKNPKQMIGLSCLFSFFNFQLGLFLAYRLDLSVGQCIVVTAFFSYVASVFLRHHVFKKVMT